MNIELKKGANMEAKHTKGPWHIKENYDNMINEEKPGRHTIKSANGWNIARIWGNVGDGTSTANARRIVACVNACEGLNPEAVPEMVKALRELAAIGEAGVVLRNETGKPQWSALDAVKAITRNALKKAGIQ